MNVHVLQEVVAQILIYKQCLFIFFILNEISKLSTQLSEISLMPKGVLSFDYCIFVSAMLGGRGKWVKAMKLDCFHNIA